MGLEKEEGMITTLLLYSWAFVLVLFVGILLGYLVRVALENRRMVAGPKNLDELLNRLMYEGGVRLTPSE